MRGTLRGMTPTPGPRAEPPAADLEAIRAVLDDLRQHVITTVEALDARLDASVTDAPPAGPTFPRPVRVPPPRMEQLARAPEPTADLDDLVDLLVPRLLDQLVPALRAALRDDS